MPTAYHMVHYRTFDAGKADIKGKTLEALCRNSLNTLSGKASLWERPEDRICDLGDGDGRGVGLVWIAILH